MGIPCTRSFAKICASVFFCFHYAINKDKRMKVLIYALIENGQVVELDGDKDVNFPSYDELKGNVHFVESNFKNAVVATNSFEADVVFPSQFYGVNVDMSNLKVKVEYTKTSLTKITTSYSTTNATVQTVYVFAN